MKAVTPSFVFRNLIGFWSGVALFFGQLSAPAQGQLDQATVRAVLQAIDRGDTNALQRIHDQNTNCVADAYYGQYGSQHYPLLQAAADGNVTMVALLLKYGADPNTAGDTRNTANAQMTALDQAAQAGSLEICQLLLAAGADSNHRNFQQTTLHFVYDDSRPATNRSAIARVLLEYGADPFAEAGYKKVTPFELEITRSDGKLISLMLDAARKTKSAAKSPASPPTAKRIAFDKLAVSQFLAARGAAMLSAAAQHAELEAVQALLKAGVSAKTNAPRELSLLQSFAIAEAAAIKSRPAAIAQWQQTSNTLRNFGPNAKPESTSFLRSEEADQAAKLAALAPEVFAQIRDLLIQNGADYDAFAATALADTSQANRLREADKNVVQARDRDGQTPLHWAVANDQLPLTSFWLTAGASPAATNFAGQTPLHMAATKGLTEQVKLLLAANAPTDIRDTNGWTPLDAAIHARQSESIHWLMAKAPVATHPERGLATPLHEAAASGNVAALTALLDTETSLEARNELGLTPLHVAGQAGQLGAAAFLIDHGADVNARDPEGNTVLHQILLSRTHWVKGRPSDAWVERRKANPGQEKFWRVYNTPSGYTSPRELAASVAFFLACGTDPAATNHAGETILQLVTADSTMLWDYDRNAILPLLQQTGNGLNARDAEGNTVLHRLCTGFYDINKVEAMASLLASGADVNATNNLGQTPLHLAAQDVELWDDGNPPVNSPFRLLVYHKANVNAQDREGMAPLHVLAMSGGSYRAQASKTLLDAGADPNLRDKQGRTPLLVLARTNTYSRKEVTRALLDGGANPNLPDEQGRTPAHLFLFGKWPWQEAADCIDMLVVAGANLSARDDQGKTPVHYLAALGNQSPMFFLRGIGDTFVLAKVDFNARDNDGNTPLQIAAKTGTRDVYDWLIKQGGNLDATNKAGETPRQQAIRSTDPFSRFQSNADTDIVQAILEGKLESVTAILKSAPELLNQTTRFGRTPLLMAAEMRRTNIVDFLDAQGVQWDPNSAIIMGRTEVLRKLIANQPQLAFDASLLVAAASSGNVPAMKILLAVGPDLKVTDAFGRSPLGAARVYKRDEICNLLTRQGATMNIFDAVYAGDTETAAGLIGKDESLISATNRFGVSLPEIVVAQGNDKVLKLLLDKGVSPTFQSPVTGMSLLDRAAEFNQTNPAELLIQRRARLDDANTSGFSPIHTAALYGSTAVLELLLQHKVDPNLRTAAADAPRPRPVSMSPTVNWRVIALQENTPLHLAALIGQTNCIAVLLKWNALLNATNADGLTPLDLASQIGERPIQASDLIDRRLPLASSTNSVIYPMSRRSATIAMLEQAGAKPGERRTRAGTIPFGPPTMSRFPSMNSATAPLTPDLQTGADYHAQGCVDYNARRFTNALANFRKSCELGSDNQDCSYFRIWLIRARLGETEAATRELAAYLENRKTGTPDDWPSKIGRFLAGKLSENDFLKAADDPNPETSKQQHWEAYFYAGSKHLIENDRMSAVDYFKKCLTTNVTDFEEYTSAAAESLILQSPRPNP